MSSKKDIKEIWKKEQLELKKKLILKDTFEWTLDESELTTQSTTNVFQ